MIFSKIFFRIMPCSFGPKLFLGGPEIFGAEPKPFGLLGEKEKVIFGLV